MEEQRTNVLELKDLRSPAGRPQTTGLFKQEGGTEYDLDEFYDIFMDSNDPTCRTFALRAFTLVPKRERWREYLRMMENPKFAGWIAEWQEDLEVKMRSEALQKIVSGEYDPKEFTRLKWLAEGRASSGTPKVGQPTKEEKQRKEKTDKRVRGLNPRAADVI